MKDPTLIGRIRDALIEGALIAVLFPLYVIGLLIDCLGKKKDE